MLHVSDDVTWSVDTFSSTGVAPEPVATQEASTSTTATPAASPDSREADYVVEMAPGDTLQEALDRVVSATDGEGVNEIRVAAGSYSGAAVWTGQLLGTIRIMGDGAVFNGGGADGYWLDISPAGGGGTVEVSGVTVTDYANGLRVSGGYSYHTRGALASTTGSPVTVTVSDVSMSRLGSAYSTGPGFAAIHLLNAAGSVSGSTFESLGSGGGMHAIYAVASDLDVIGNSFGYVSGDPVRYRHLSTGVVSSNSFAYPGLYAQVSTWFCDAECAEENGQSVECPSAPTVSGASFVNTVTSRADSRCGT